MLLMAVRATAAYERLACLMVTQGRCSPRWLLSLTYRAECCTVSLASAAWSLTSAAAVVASSRTVSAARVAAALTYSIRAFDTATAAGALVGLRHVVLRR